MPHNEKGPILVVDDDRDLREARRETLEYKGFDVVEAEDGLAALEYLRANGAPPLVLLDWNMPGMNAPEFMEAFSKEPSFGKTPVVLVSADDRVADKAKTNDYAGYLRKPIALPLLQATVERYCGTGA
jgi:two-component system, chemotaxis family, chemotaxis protein CheY